MKNEGSSACRDRGRGCFTLIELLVVMAIIAILASMLLPALGRARERASGVVCAGNFKQFGIVFGLYTDDNDGCIPTHLYPGAGDRQWLQVMERYLPGYAWGAGRKARLLTCPSAHSKLVAYYHSDIVLNSQASVRCGDQCVQNDDRYRRTPVRASVHRRPSATLEACEYTARGSSGYLVLGTYNQFKALRDETNPRWHVEDYYRHGRRMSVAYLDGHVVACTPFEVNPSPWIDPRVPPFSSCR